MSTAPDDIVTPETASPGEDDPALRPQLLEDFSGQPGAREDLEIALHGARERNEPLEHILLSGPPGLGKTTLAMILKNEMGVECRAVMAPALQRQADLATILVSLQPGDILFIDEIHRLPIALEELLYPALEDFSISLPISDAGEGTKAVTLHLSRFTLVGATTTSGMLSRPMRDRFGIDVRLSLYSAEDLTKVVERSASLLGMKLSEGVAFNISRRARGTPRIANRLLRRVRDYASREKASEVTMEIANAAFKWLRIDEHGLDELDRKYLNALGNRYTKRAVGLKTISAALGEREETLEEEVEPWLLQQALIERTTRGRMITEKGIDILS